MFIYVFINLSFYFYGILSRNNVKRFFSESFRRIPKSICDAFALNHSKMGQTTRKKFRSNSFSEKRSTEALEVKKIITKREKDRELNAYQMKKKCKINLSDDDDVG